MELSPYVEIHSKTNSHNAVIAVAILIVSSIISAVIIYKQHGIKLYPFQQELIAGLVIFDAIAITVLVRIGRMNNTASKEVKG